MHEAEDRARESVDRIVSAGKAVGRKVGSFVFKKLMALLLPYLPLIIVGVLVFLLLALLVAGIYSTMCPNSYMTGVTESPMDKAIRAKYASLTSVIWGEGEAWNAADTYLVPDEPFKKTKLYPRTDFENMHALRDKYRQDFTLSLKWGTVHAVCLYWQYIFNEQEIPDDLREKVAKDLHPYFYYIKRQESETVSGPDGSSTSTWDVYLLVEAHTIEGYFQYHYEPVTETRTFGDTTVTTTTWQLKDVIQLWPDRYQWIKEYLRELYKLEGIQNEEDELEQARYWVMEAGKGFTEQREWLDWLLSYSDALANSSMAMIPPEYVPFLKEAEERFHIPMWFLAALFQSESSWNPLAVNSDTGCFGISQQHPAYWRQRWEKLGFVPPELYQWDPRAQILAGAMVIADYLGDPTKIDWDGDLRNDVRVIRAIARYKGWSNWARITPDSLAGEEKRQIEIVLGFAKGMQAEAVWPVPGHYAVTSPFGMRYHPIKQRYSLHTGIDIDLETGTPVVSVSGGRVTFVGWNGDWGYEITVSDNVHLYQYAHLLPNSAKVKVGDFVRPGQELALGDSTGSSTGPHLHFGVKDLARDCWVDPLLVLPHPPGLVVQ